MTRGNTGEGTQCVDVVAFRKPARSVTASPAGLVSLVGIALGVAVFIAVRVTNTSTLGAFARTVDAIAGRAGLEITGRGALLDETVLPQARRCRAWRLWPPGAG